LDEVLHISTAFGIIATCSDTELLRFNASSYLLVEEDLLDSE